MKTEKVNMYMYLVSYYFTTIKHSLDIYFPRCLKVKDDIKVFWQYCKVFWQYFWQYWTQWTMNPQIYVNSPDLRSEENSQSKFKIFF